MKAEGLLGIGAVSVIHPGSMAGITAQTAAVPPVLSIARGRADAQLMEEGRATKAVCSGFWPARVLGLLAGCWARLFSLQTRQWFRFPSGEVVAKQAVGSMERRAREDSSVKCA